MSNLLRVCAVLSAVAAAAASATAPATPPPSPAPYPPYPRRSAEPTQAPVSRIENLDVTNPISGLTVTTEPNPLAGWTITAHNETDGSMLVLWDESTFVGANGRSWGRLIPTTTRKMDIERPHPAAPLPPRSASTQTVIPENSITAYEIGIDESAQIDGGRLVLVFETPAGKATWQAVVHVTGRGE